MGSPSLEECLDIALEASQEAVGIINRAANSAISVTSKGNEGVVTDADKAAEAAIRTVLRRHTEYPILGEEAGIDVEREGPKWIVDPIDGTANFSLGIPLCAVSIALMEGYRSLLGIIAHPSGWTVSGIRGKGAWCAGRQLVRPSPRAGRPLVILDTGYALENERKAAALLAAAAGRFAVRMFGSTALSLAYVALGRADAFLSSGDKIWDFAAGLCIAAESGRLTTDWAGQPWETGDHDHLLAADPAVHHALVEAAGPLQTT